MRKLDLPRVERENANQGSDGQGQGGGNERERPLGNHKRSQMCRQSRGIFSKFHMLLPRCPIWPLTTGPPLCTAPHYITHLSLRTMRTWPQHMLYSQKQCIVDKKRKPWTMAAKRSADSDTLLMAAVHDEIASLFCGLFFKHAFRWQRMLKLTRSSFKFLFSDANFTVSLYWVGWGKKKKKLK